LTPLKNFTSLSYWKTKNTHYFYCSLLTKYSNLVSFFIALRLELTSHESKTTTTAVTPRLQGIALSCHDVNCVTKLCRGDRWVLSLSHHVSNNIFSCQLFVFFLSTPFYNFSFFGDFVMLLMYILISIYKFLAWFSFLVVW
jgi:hypothetical protein